MNDVSLVSGFPAKITDRCILAASDSNACVSPLYLIFARIISVTLFPVCVMVDFLLYSGDVFVEWIGSKCASTKAACQKHTEKMYHAIDVVKRCALGIIAFLAGLISPDIVSEHFLRNDAPSGVIEHYGKLYRGKGICKYPKNEEELKAIVQEAIASGKKIALVGAGMSQGKQALPTGEDNFLIDMRYFNQVSVSKDAKTAIVGAGATWNTVQHKANEEGLAVRVMQASNVFTFAGSASINCHGWDHTVGPLGNTILSLKVMTADGDIKTITRDDELFHYIIGGLGGFGIIIEATISLIDNELLSEEGEEVSPDKYLDYFEKINKDESVRMHLYRLSLDPNHLLETGVAVNYRCKGESKSNVSLIDEKPNGTRMDRIKLHLGRRFKLLRKLGWGIEKKVALTTKEGYRNQVMRPPINPVFNHSRASAEWLQEYFISKEELPKFLEFMKKILIKNDVNLLNASLRFVKKDENAALKYAKEDRFALVLFFNQSLANKEVEKTKGWVREVNDYLKDHNGAFYLPYEQFAKKEQFKGCYPEWENIIKAKRRLDPKGLFMNGFYEKYLQEKV